MRQTFVWRRGTGARTIARIFAAATALAATPAFADYVIAPAGGDITGAKLSVQLAAGDVTLAAASGDLVVNDAVNWSAHTLTLSAPSGGVKVNAVMTAAGSAGLSLETAASQADGGVAMALTAGGFTGRVDFSGSGQTYRVNGTAYTLIHSIAELEALRSGGGAITGAYALAADVDWSGAASQTPLGDLGGRFDGLGHRVLDLVIPGGADHSGLFSSTEGSAVIRNVGVRGGSVSGGQWVGPLVGYSSGVISHVYSTADVSGTSFVGGLVGQHGASGSLIADAWAGGNVTGTRVLGGLVGSTSAGGAVNNAWASGNVTGSQDRIGGLVGVTDTHAVAGEILRNAYATGNVAGNSQVGGLVGQSMSPVEHVFATGSVSAVVDAGGLVGLDSSGPGDVSDGWFASDTPGTHPDNGVGTAISLANLISALPGSFDAAVWANQNNQTTPYLKSLPGVMYVKAESATPAAALIYTPVVTLDQLQAINNDLAGHFALLNDIDASATRDWNDGAGFVPIGNCAGGLDGRFDGLGHVVIDPFIHPAGSGALCVGLFGGIGIGGVVRNVGVDGGTVAGASFVGGLVGFNDAGTISHAYATASVTASTAQGGGLVGFTDGDVSDAYATGSVTVGGDGAGGLTAGSRGAITRTWASGAVTGSGSNVGGLVGHAMEGSVADSYWDSFSTGQGVAVGVVGGGTVTNLNAVTSDPAQGAAANYAFRQGAYASLGTFGDTPGSATWTMVDGSTRPFLQMEYTTAIGTTHALQLMTMAKDANYTLERHLDASETGRANGLAVNSGGMWAPSGFVPVGTDGPRFVGGFDGQHHVISGLTIRRPGEAWVGLFGKTGAVLVHDVGLGNVAVSGQSNVGGLIGLGQGATIDNVYVSGHVSAVQGIGGVAGAIEQGSLSNAYAHADVSCTVNYVGGLVGVSAGSIAHAYAVGNVSGFNLAGLVGHNADASGGALADTFWDRNFVHQAVGSADTVDGLLTGITGLYTVQWPSQGPIASGQWDAGWVAGYPYPVRDGFPYVRVVAQGAHITHGVAAVAVDSYSVIDQDGNDASALVTGTPTVPTASAGSVPSPTSAAPVWRRRSRSTS